MIGIICPTCAVTLGMQPRGQFNLSKFETFACSCLGISQRGCAISGDRADRIVLVRYS